MKRALGPALRPQKKKAPRACENRESWRPKHAGANAYIHVCVSVYIYIYVWSVGLLALDRRPGPWEIGQAKPSRRLIRPHKAFIKPL